jgi:hypothetical protein
MSRERISGVDTAWLRMDSPTNLMMIVGVMMFAERLDLDAVKRIIAERFLAFPRLRCQRRAGCGGRLVGDGRGLDIDWHVRRTLGAGASARPRSKRW